jgi:hypothetical protein
MKTSTAYTIVFTDGNGTPTKALGFGELFLTPSSVKAKLTALKAKAKKSKTFNKTWGYAAMRLTAVA